MEYNLNKNASLATNMLAGAIIGSMVLSGRSLAQHGIRSQGGAFIPATKAVSPDPEIGSLDNQYNQRNINSAKGRADRSLYTGLGEGMMAGALWGAGAGAAYSGIEAWLRSMRKKRRREEALSKHAKDEYEELGDGYRMRIDTPEDRNMARRIRHLSRPYGFGGALVEAMPAALLAAAVGGLGSAALSGGDVTAGVIGAAASGLGTALWNGMGNADVRRMSVDAAIEKTLQEQQQLKGNSKR